MKRPPPRPTPPRRRTAREIIKARVRELDIEITILRARQQELERLLNNGEIE